jgi:exodeoxyribonuclease VII small subunit
MTETGQGFETTIRELEDIVSALETETLELDEALRLFERGVERLRLATRLLDRAHGRVEELVEEATGRPSVVPFETGEVETGGADPD